MEAFHQIYNRLNYLELWKELAVRPTVEQCHDDDQDLLSSDADDLTLLSERCLAVRQQLNQSLPPHDLALDHLLQVKDSNIPNAGKGLFFYAASNKSESHDAQNALTDNIIPCNTIICYYTGHIHNNFSQRHLVKDKSYLMNVAGDLFVDPRPMTSIKARFINDPLNPDAVNCTFVPEPDHRRCAVVASKDIQSGEELFVSYGDFYWSQQSVSGTFHATS